jgi:hypothetical protein
MIKIKIRHSKNSPPIDKTDVEFNTQTKVDGYGLTSPDNVIGSSGDPFRASSAFPRYAMEEAECDCQCEECAQEEHEQKKYFEEYLAEGLEESILYEKKDRCYRLAKRKYKVFPSAYASGFIVRCRKGKVARKKKNKKRKNEEIELSESFEIDIDELLEEGTFDKEKKSELHGWFSRRGEKGKKKGWVDCNTCRKDPKTGRKTCKSCGRQSGEKRSKYPACRPTPSACTKSGTSRKKSSKRISWKPKKKEE